MLLCKDRKAALAAFISVWLAYGVSAQVRDTTYERKVGEVTVVEKARPSVKREAAPLQVIDGKSIEMLGLQDLSDAVRRFSGVTVKDYGGIGGLKTVSIRSLGAHHTAVSYDGVAISDAQSGQIDISRFTLDNVEMVSLSMGQTDDIFRTARIYASAGALNIQTKKPHFEERPFSLSAKMKGGSFGLLNPTLSFARKIGERWAATALADYMQADGDYPFSLKNGNVSTREHRINSDIKTFRAESDIYGDFGRGGTLETKLYTFHSKRGLPGSVNFYDKTAFERLRNDNSFVQTHYKNAFGERLSVQAVAKYNYAYSRYKDVSENYAAGYQEDRNTQHEIYGSVGALYRPAEHFSASLTADFSHARLRNNFLNAKQPDRNTSLAVAAAQYKNSRFTATASLLGTYISDKVQNGDRPADRKRLSPAFAASWRPFSTSALRIRASYKSIFRVPTFTDLYYLRTGNTTLKPEDAKQFNAGLTMSGSIGEAVRYFSVSADGYYNKVENKIVALPTLYVWKMMNMGDVEIKGADVNLSAEIPVGSRVSCIISGNYTYQHAVDVSDKSAKNYKHQIPYTPRHAGGGSLTVENPWVNVSYILTAVGDRYALPQNIASNRVGAYAEQSVSLNRTFAWRSAKLRLQGEILNIADAQYDVIQYYPMPGRSWRLSLTLTI